jgi:hypothetical protein
VAAFHEEGEVIVIPLIVVSTASTAYCADADPAFVDMKHQTRNLNLNAVREMIIENTEGTYQFIMWISLVESIRFLRLQKNIIYVLSGTHTTQLAWNGTVK